MTTMLVTLSGAMSRAQTKTCSAISRAFRFLLIPSSPVAQNVQPIGQPTCVEMQTVRLAVSGVEQILPRTVGSLGDTLQCQDGCRSHFRERRLQSSGQVRGLSPVAHQRTGEGSVDLADAVRWFVPLFQNSPHIR